MIDLYREKFEEALCSFCLDLPDYNHSLNAAMKYSLLSGGKRLRPGSLLMSYSLYDTDLEEVMPYAIAIELIHTYSIIHDDLPAMDNDDYRRGLQTVHKKFDEATAILTGDALLTHAFKIMSDSILLTADTDRLVNKVKALNIISRRAGIEGMILGQIIDMEDGRLSPKELSFMYNRKTSDLFVASMLCGAIIGGASDPELELIENFATNLGMAFQIKDDIQDYDRDLLIGKVTMVNVLGVDEGEKLMKEYADSAKECLGLLCGSYNRDITALRSLMDYIMGY